MDCDAVIIGSRAWNECTKEKDAPRPNDLDLVMKWSKFEQFVKDNKANILTVAQANIETYYNTAIKFVVHLKNLQKLEVEIGDVFPTFGPLRWGTGTKLTSGLTVGEGKHAQTVPGTYFVPPKSSLMALKISHITLPTHWRKTSADLARMLEHFAPHTLEQILSDPEKSDPQSTNGPKLRDLVKERLLENVAMQYTIQGKQLPCADWKSTAGILATASEARTLFNYIKAGNESSFLSAIKPAQQEKPVGGAKKSAAGKKTQAAPKEREVILQTRFLPLKLSEKAFQALPPVERRRVLLEIVMAVATYYYLQSKRLDAWFDPSSKMTARDIAHEAYMLALEAICTNALPSPTPIEKPRAAGSPEPLDPDFARWLQQIALYDKPPGSMTRAQVDNLLHPQPVYTDPSRELNSHVNLDHLRANPQRVKIPSLDVVTAMGVLNPVTDPLVFAIISELPFLMNMPPHMTNIVSKIMEERGAAPVPLPVDVWQHVAQVGAEDHTIVLALSAVNKSLNNIIMKSDSSKQMWLRLLRALWDEKNIKRATGLETIIYSPDTALDMFKNTWQWKHKRYHAVPVECAHCGDRHEPIPIEVWLKKNGGEHTEYFCACPDCYEATGSWGTCEYHELTIIS